VQYPFSKYIIECNIIQAIQNIIMLDFAIVNIKFTTITNIMKIHKELINNISSILKTTEEQYKKCSAL
jgi:p-aminobenzoyl-glutamate transporter AbgT